MARRLTILGALGLLMSGLALVANWAAEQATQVRGAFAVAASGGRVLVNAGREVLLTSEEGAVLAVLKEPSGRPWRFGEVCSVAFGLDGSPLVSDAERGQLVRSQPDGTGGRLVPLAERPRLTFEAVDLGDGYFIADTMRHEVRVVSATGETLRRRSVSYPNAAQLASTEPLRVALVSTGTAKAFLYDVATLEPVAHEALQRLNDGRARGGAKRELFELALFEGGAVGADCRDTLGECTILRAAAGLERIADTVPFALAEPETTEGLLGVGELALTRAGALLLASPRLGVVLRFDSAGGPPPDGFCQSCGEGDFPPAIDVWTLEREARTWPNGARVSLFGASELVARFAEIRDARLRLLLLERGARHASYGVASLLLLGLFLSRQAGAAANAESRLARGWRELVRPHRGTYLLALGAVALAFAAVAGLAAWLAGAGVAFAAGVVAAFFASRLVAAPLLARRLPPDAARAAWELYLGAGAKLPVALEAGESLRWVRFGWPRRAVASLVTQANAARGADDAIDLLESLAPRLTLLARTDRRLLAANTSMLGAPRDLVLALEIPEGLEAPPARLEVQTPRFARAWALDSANAPASAFAEGVHWLCEACRQPLGSCPHHAPALLGPAALSVLLPGLGHLVTGELGKARALLVVATGLLLQAFGTWLPQHVGTLPPAPERWQQPLWIYGLTGAIAAAAIAVRWWRDRSRYSAGHKK